ncbi:hypothetical protein OK348_13905 [Flavobacterium sp. MXW15]|uniref:Uncharacterized protein n=1 Tax=Xanthomonas chitinilytica TaxID=2989819 RepID=A0ABT3JXS5_9XANT|nr:hypothetical protein [Xanthomonas sp. H13-6]MCW4455880.1 hypothetical protein [Flavobacterium sp. MXW15]MCW4473256.1 hypothetical protein [Xanthomonas sp. H13-6]
MSRQVTSPPRRRAAAPEIQRPLATVAIGGIVSSTLPVLYRWAYRHDNAGDGAGQED